MLIKAANEKAFVGKYIPMLHNTLKLLVPAGDAERNNSLNVRNRDNNMMPQTDSHRRHSGVAAFNCFLGLPTSTLRGTTKAIIRRLLAFLSQKQTWVIGLFCLLCTPQTHLVPPPSLLCPGVLYSALSLCCYYSPTPRRREAPHVIPKAISLICCDTQ